MTARGRLRAIRWSDRLAFAALAVALLACLLSEHPVWRPKVSVRSCGGNFELLCAFARGFERRHNCRVEVIAAPVQYLLELAAADERHLPEVMVGRSGPGWALLQKQGCLARPPEVFAIDPLVIVTPRGNPAGVRSLADLGRDGVRVLAAADAMRPKGRVIGSLMADVSEALYPGLVDRWERNTVEEVHCARLLARRLRDGGGDAAILARSQAAQPPLAEACDVVEIPPSVLDLMRSGRGSLPQSVGRTVRNPRNEPADRFVAELAGGADGLVARCGYIPQGAPDFVRYEALLAPSSPQPIAARQMALAAALQRDGARREAVRRYLHVIHVFGPSRWDAEAWYRIGALLREMGELAACRNVWQCLVWRYPTRGHKEWLGILAIGEDAGAAPEKPWVARAAAALAEMPPATPVAGPPQWWAEVTPAPFTVREGDPPKGARRTLAVAADLLHLGLADFAVRDALKVTSLHFPSPHMAAARTVAGTALLQGGDGDAARQQWHTVAADDARSSWAVPCAAACVASAAAKPLPAPAARRVAMPPTAAAYDTHVDRAMTYASELSEAGLPLYALKEYLKVIVGAYGEPTRVAEARFRAGLCLTAMGRPTAAVRQWDLCPSEDGAVEWQEQARQSAGLLGEAGPARDADLRRAIALPTAVTARPGGGGGPRARKGTRPQALARLHLGEELLIAGVLDEDEALQEFLKVLTVIEVPPALEWTRTVAHLRAAQALVLSERPGKAEFHAEQAARAERPAESVAQAERLLAYLRRDGGVQP
jgi:molybdate transport system substrate-binding protein